jgi:site-specific recombinase XerD
MTKNLLDLAAMLDSWQLALRAERKSEHTVRVYTTGVRRFLVWCETTGTDPVLDRATVQRFITALLDGGTEAASARSRQLALRRFAAWLHAEGELDDNPIIGLKPPQLDVKVVEPLTDDELRRLIKTCAGRTLRDRRDEAIVRLMAETGMRAGEVVALRTSDVDLHRGIATVRRGKGGKGRVVPFSPQTATAIDRYLRTRRTHRLAGTPNLWLGQRGMTFSYKGLARSLEMRAQDAGLTGFHPHLLRHTAATRWLAAGGSEGGLMAVAGWAKRDMLDRYSQATASDRAAAEARTLGLGDL